MREKEIKWMRNIYTKKDIFLHTCVNSSNEKDDKMEEKEMHRERDRYLSPYLCQVV